MAIAVDNLADADSLTTVEKEEGEGEEGEGEEKPGSHEATPMGITDDGFMEHDKNNLDSENEMNM